VAIGSINKVLADSACWYVGDFKNTKDVYCFALNGQLKWKCNLDQVRPIREVLDFDLSPDDGTLTVVKGEHCYQYDRQGQLIATRNSPFLSGKIACLSRQRTLLARPGSSNAAVTELGLISETGEFASPVVGFRSPFNNAVTGISNLNPTFRFDTLLYGSLLNDTLYHVWPTGLQPYATVRYATANTATRLDFADLDYPTAMAQLSNNNTTTGCDILYETEHTLHFVALYQGRYHSVYYDKNRHTTARIGASSDDLLGGRLGFLPRATLPGNRYVYVLEPYTLFQPDQPGAVAGPLLAEIKAKVNPLSNPVLVVGQFKSVQNQQLVQNEKTNH
jgi:hypothetical protein